VQLREEPPPPIFAESATDLFVCYASADGVEAAHQIATYFEKRGVKCWIAPRNILPGTSWPRAIVDGIEASRAMLLVVTEEASSSPEIEKEVTLATHMRKPIFPVRLGNITLTGTLRYHTQNYQWRDLFPNRDKPLDEIADQIKSLRQDSVNVSIERVMQRKPLALPDRPSIAVLPFSNLGGDPEQEYFAEGIAEDIISALSRIPSLLVIARNSSFSYKGKSVDTKRMGAELGVRYILQGSVRRTVSRIRIAGQLSEASEGWQIWSDRFDGPIQDIFDLQDQVTERVAGALEIELQDAEIKRQKFKPTESLTAYDHMLRGIASFNAQLQQSTVDALENFHKAISLDPTYAVAYAYAATTLVLRRAHGWLLDPAREAEECISLARNAAELGGEDPLALCLAGVCQIYLGHELEISSQLIDRSLILNPNSALGWYGSGLARICFGDLDEAITRIARATRLDPRDPAGYLYYVSVGLATFLTGRFAEAIKFVDGSLATHPTYLPALRIKAASLALLGNTDEARVIIAGIRKHDPKFSLSTVAQRMIKLQPIHMDLYCKGLKLAGLDV
jgi:TolB-like protein